MHSDSVISLTWLEIEWEANWLSWPKDIGEMAEEIFGEILSPDCPLKFCGDVNGIGETRSVLFSLIWRENSAKLGAFLLPTVASEGETSEARRR